MPFAGFELSPPETIVFFIVIVGTWLMGAIVVLLGLWLVVQTFLAIRYPMTKTGNNRRKIVGLAWASMALIVAVTTAQGVIGKKVSDSNNQKVALKYAKTYRYPVILPEASDYRMGFDQKWGQLSIYAPPGAATKFDIVQVPLTEVGRKYFDVTKGLCDFSTMRENWDALIAKNETCQLFASVGNFMIYRSSLSNYYALYEDIVISVNADPDKIKQVVSDFKITDANELTEVVGTNKFDGAYSEVLDRWHREGRF